jgi:formylglycine-generating enzyme required for sulfatase activity
MTLRQFLAEELAGAAAVTVKEHIDACPVCQQELGRLVGGAPGPLEALFCESETLCTTTIGEAAPEAITSISAPVEVPGYELLAEVGRGGMGVVYKARQLRPARIVALKMLLAGRQASHEERARFLGEAQAVAQLQHPHIVALYDAGQHGDLLYFTLEFVGGGSLARLLRGAPLPPDNAARLVQQVARGIQYAHERGIFHRDLKPGNILLQTGEPAPPTDNQTAPEKERELLLERAIPKIADFGLAKNLAVDSALTPTDAVLGTPSYMAPEQASSVKRAGAAADVYALGAILYECLTGRPPFHGPTHVDTLLQVLHDEPIAPSVLQRGIPRDLETCSLKCLQKDPHRRYSSAGEMAEDLRRFLAGEPIRARPVGRGERALKWCRRHPAVAALSALVLLVSLIGAGLVTWQWQETRAALSQMRSEKAARLQRQVAALPDAAPGRVPAIIEELGASREEVLPLLRQRYQQEEERPRRMRLALALAPVAPDLVQQPLIDWMLEAEDPAEVLLVREVLLPHRVEGQAPHQEPLLQRLWSVAQAPGKGQEAPRLRAAMALAKFDPTSEKWAQVQNAIVDDLVAVPAIYFSAWFDGFHPVREKLVAPLKAVFQDTRRPDGERSMATGFLVPYAAGQPRLLADLLMLADDKQFSAIYPKLKECGEQAVPLLLAELDKKPAVFQGKVIFQTKGMIAQDDPKYQVFDASFPAKKFQVQFRANKTYRLTMDSRDIDAAVVLEDSGGLFLASDDDSGGDRNALLDYVALRDDTYTVIAGSLKGAGAFELTVRAKAAGDDPKEVLAKRQATAAVGLLRMNRPEKAWPLLRHSPEPRVRSYLIQRLGPMAVDASAIAKRLHEEPDLSAQRALLLSLGEFDDKGLPPAARQALFPRFRDIYQTAFDPGLHAAAEWLLRSWQQDEWLQQVNAAWAKDKEGRRQKLDRFKALVADHKEKAAPGWYVNSQGQTMVMIPGPVEFMMGSPGTELGRALTAELQHKKRIRRAFALAATPVTRAQFLRAVPKFTERFQFEVKRFPDPSCPIGAVQWYEAAAYCNWLSEQEGIPKDQWCYEQDADKKVTRLKDNYLSLEGYRLPREAEVEYACRAGAVTSRFYGDAEELLGKYGWYLTNSDYRTWPVGAKLPNDFGFFDMLGNVATWCQDSVPIVAREDLGFEDEDKTVDLVPTIGRMMRGGGFDSPASTLRCAFRIDLLPLARMLAVGLRPARTLRIE